MTMTGEVTRLDAMKKEFCDSLADLTSNSRPAIVALTMIAEENSIYAPEIVKCILDHVEKVPSTMKLPALYLIDSILKNYPSVYMPLFYPYLDKVFFQIYSQVAQQTRQQLLKLRLTWTGLVPPPLLAQMDNSIKAIDSSWQIPPFVNGIPQHLPTKQVPRMDQPRFSQNVTKRDIHSSSPASNRTVINKPLVQPIQFRPKKLSRNFVPIIPAKNLNPPPTTSNHQSNGNAAAVATTTVASSSSSMADPNNARQIKIQPVSSALLSAIKSRDPRMMYGKGRGFPPGVRFNTVCIAKIPGTLASANEGVKQHQQQRRQQQQQQRRQQQHLLQQSSSFARKDDCNRSTDDVVVGVGTKRKFPEENENNEGKKEEAEGKSSKSNNKKMKSSSSKEGERRERKEKSGKEKHKSGKKEKKDKPEKRSSDKGGKGVGEEREKGSKTKSDKMVAEETEVAAGNEKEFADAADGEDRDLRRMFAVADHPFGNTGASDVDYRRLNVKNFDKIKKLRMQVNREDRNEAKDIAIASFVEEKLKEIMDGTPSELANDAKSSLDGNADGQMLDASSKRSPSPTLEPPPAPIISSSLSPPISFKSPPRTFKSPPRSFKSPPRSFKSPPRSFKSPPRSFKSPPRSFKSPPRTFRSPPRPFRSPPSLFKSPPRSFKSPPPAPKISALLDESHAAYSASASVIPTVPPTDLQLLMKMESEDSSLKTIKINGQPRYIRHYAKASIIFVRDNDPRDVGFSRGNNHSSVRKIYVNEHPGTPFNMHKGVPVPLHTEQDHQIMVRGAYHGFRFGVPTRELVIDGKSYECAFGLGFNSLGPPLQVIMHDSPVLIALSGPSPQVAHGPVRRTDIVAGFVNIIVDEKHHFILCLDGTPQRINVNTIPIIVHFANSLLKILLNNRPFDADFGGPPQSFVFCDKVCRFRLSELPHGVHAGHVKIHDMPVISNATILHSPPRPKPESNTTAPVVAVSSVPMEMETNGGHHHVPPSSILDAFMPPAATVELPFLSTKSFWDNVAASFSNSASLKRKNREYADALYEGMQCGTCGLRFAAEDNARYGQHLDWHFRKNKLSRDASKVQSQKWYYEARDWREFYEMDERTLEVNEDENEPKIEQTEAEEPSISCVGREGVCCSVCQDKMLEFFDEDREEWHFKNALEVDGRVYHASCQRPPATQSVDVDASAEIYAAAEISVAAVAEEIPLILDVKVKTEKVDNGDEIALSTSSSNAGDKVDDIVGDKIDVIVSDKIDDTVGDKIDHIVDDKIDDIVGDKIDNIVDDKIDNIVDDKIDNILGDNIDDIVVDKIDDDNDDDDDVEVQVIEPTIEEIVIEDDESAMEVEPNLEIIAAAEVRGKCQEETEEKGGEEMSTTQEEKVVEEEPSSSLEGDSGRTGKISINLSEKTALLGAKLITYPAKVDEDRVKCSLCSIM